MASAGPRRWPLLRRRQVWLPTWRGWLCLLVLVVGLFVWLFRALYPFLALSQPVPGADIMVIEGWVPDHVIQAATAEFKRDHYRLVVAAGGSRPKGSTLSTYRTYAALTAATLLKVGLPPDQVIEAAGALTGRGRTLHSAQAVRAKLAELRVTPSALNVVTEGPHARRTWTVFHRVFGPPVRLGVISYPPEDYDPRRWWATSEGAKVTVTEAIGWLHEWLFGWASD